MLCPKCHKPLADEEDGLYICCADADLQWQCGACGKVSEGFAFPYGRCPQCGGKLALRDEGPSVSSDGAALAAVRMAFEIELGGRAFYQNAAADCSDEELRALFGRFAAMEGEHMETLSRRYHVQAPDSPHESGIERAAIFGEVAHQPGDPDSLFRIAIALEKKAAEFFATRSAAAPAGSPEQRLYLELGAEEQDHMNLLATEYARWRAQKPGLFSGNPQ
jgi:glutamate synthase (NADPH) small chain